MDNLEIIDEDKRVAGTAARTAAMKEANPVGSAALYTQQESSEQIYVPEEDIKIIDANDDDPHNMSGGFKDIINVEFQG